MGSGGDTKQCAPRRKFGDIPEPRYKKYPYGWSCVLTHQRIAGIEIIHDSYLIRVPYFMEFNFDNSEIESDSHSIIFWFIGVVGNQDFACTVGNHIQKNVNQILDPKIQYNLLKHCGTITNRNYFFVSEIQYATNWF